MHNFAEDYKNVASIRDRGPYSAYKLLIISGLKLNSRGSQIALATGPLHLSAGGG